MTTNASSDDAIDAADDFVMVQNPLSLKVTPKHTSIGVDSKLKSTQVVATITAGELPDDEQRAPVDIVVALDVSGSMGGSKLRLCKSTLGLLLRTLGTSDRFALVTYASNVRVDIPVRAMTEDNKKKAIDTIEQLRTRGSTNISAAISMAFQEIQRIETPNKVQTIFLLTDGMANLGIRDDDGLVELSRNCLRRSQDTDNPITMHTFGYGRDHRSELLAKLSSVAKGGSYYFVEDDSAVGTAFGDALGGVLSVVAQGITLVIQPPPGENNILKIHHDQAIRRENGYYTVHFNDMYAEETRDVLFEVELLKPFDDALGFEIEFLKPVDEQKPLNHAKITLSYVDTIRKEQIDSEPVECFIKRPMGSEVSANDPYVTKQWLRLCAVTEMKIAQEKARTGNLASARSSVMSWQQLARRECERNGELEDDAMTCQLRADMDELLTGMNSVQDYNSSTSMKMTSISNQHYHQRCSASTMDMPNIYRSKKKYSMSKKLTKQPKTL